MIELPHPLASAAQWRPDHPLVVADDATWFAGDLMQAAARAAASLREQGVSESDVVAVVGEPTAAFALALHTVGWLGATVLPISSTLPAAALRRRMGAAGAHLVVGAAPSELPDGVRQLTLDVTHPKALPERFWPLEERRLIIATSGTSGEPKLVPLTTAQIAFSAWGSLLRLGHEPGDRWLGCLPIDHIGGLSVLLRAALYCSTAVLHRRFDAARVATTLDSGEVTQVSLVPALLQRVLAARPPRPFPRSLRAILVGGAAIDADLLAQARQLSLPIAITWGMSEAASQIATCEPGVLDGTAGAPLAFARVESQNGELRVRGPLVQRELATGDRGEVAGGRVVVHGRADNIINCGGTKIDPLAVENALCTHPAVAQALVLPLASAALGQVPAAVLVARGEPVPAASLLDHCAKTLPRVMLPRRITWTTALPLDALGKPSRRLAALLLGDTDAPQPLGEVRRHGTGREGLAVDEGVLELSGSAQGAIGPADSIGKGDRGVTEPRQRQLDTQPVAHAHRRLEVGLGVHERHAPIGGDEKFLHVAERGGEHLLERRVAVLEKATEKGDAGPIDLEKSHRQQMHEGHRSVPIGKEEV